MTFVFHFPFSIVIFSHIKFILLPCSLSNTFSLLPYLIPYAIVPSLLSNPTLRLFYLLLPFSLPLTLPLPSSPPPRPPPGHIRRCRSSTESGFKRIMGYGLRRKTVCLHTVLHFKVRITDLLIFPVLSFTILNKS